MRVAIAIAMVAMVGWSSGGIAASSHKSLHERFTAANTSHDGHLTLEQAKTGLKSVAKRFDLIDKDHKGYVTEDQIHAYYKSLHHHARAERQKS